MTDTEFDQQRDDTPGERRAHPGSVWLREEPTRSRPIPLTRQRIVDAAVALLDEHGIDGLTMRRLAQMLDVTPTALYWHVKTKDDVLDLALDHVFGNVPLPEATDDWRGDARTLIRNWRAVMLRHPWAPSLIGRPMLGPNVLARTEHLQSTLARGGLSDVELTVVTRTLANYVIGAALTEATWHRSADPQEQTEARRHITADPDAYPTLNSSGHLDTARWSEDDIFERGLDLILVGTPNANGE
ncbi:TetR/AcrR family transcriptional regulator C-terminal domain-containing protein [Micromonospora sp. NBRC 101691]|uniref:TetR/AcrR family transcriptional regulator n=1 Tax=Micromonospora sp. NBRC 101691 TaxID=3032198 RepID=UPI0024A22C10|nr:TetR/AcrR family transcriptional regulator C-terminal domain-containing protein [Micromonospora sp. NBRC 101691]GLY23522.1 TetR family transcriptional regulator [Micromonospora sp. NBRC 101691]